VQQRSTKSTHSWIQSFARQFRVTRFRLPNLILSSIWGDMITTSPYPVNVGNVRGVSCYQRRLTATTHRAAGAMVRPLHDHTCCK
jgi:hypothetical protein